MRFAEEGAKIIVNDVNEQDANNVVDQVKSKGGRAIAVLGSVSDRPTVQKMVDTAVKEFGTLDIIVNNAGITHSARLAETTTADYDRCMAINARGPYILCREAIPWLGKMGRGYIINISSVVGVKGYPLQTAYGASR
mgnify:CR=1 FL=1